MERPRAERAGGLLVTLCLLAAHGSTALLNTGLVLLLLMGLRALWSRGRFPWGGSLLGAGAPLWVYTVASFVGIALGVSPRTSAAKLTELKKPAVASVLGTLGVTIPSIRMACTTLMGFLVFLGGYAIYERAFVTWWRVKAFSPSVNDLAALVMLDASLIAAFILAGDRSLRQSPLTWLAFTSAVVTLILSGTRSTMLGFGIALTAGGWLARNEGSRRLTAAMFALVLALLIVVPSPLLSRTTEALNLSDEGISYRTSVARIAIRQFLDHPVSGVGRGNFEKVHETMKAPGTERKPHAHNNALHLLAELGVLGIGSYLWLLGRLGLSLVQGFSARPAGDFGRAFLLGVFMATVSFFISGFFIYTWGYQMASSLWWLMLGMSAALYPGPVPEGSGSLPV